MPVIDNTSSAYNENTTVSWEAELQNSKILLFEVNKGINTLIKSGHSSYSLNTGQNQQDVRRLSLQELREMRNDLLFQINELENILGIQTKTLQMLPGF